MNLNFKNEVYEVMKGVPMGKVVSYGQLATMAGHPGAARVVGQIAHFGPSHLPWHRLVHSSGKMANGFVPGGPSHQQEMLEQEGVIFVNGKVNMKDFQLA